MSISDIVVGCATVFMRHWYDSCRVSRWRRGYGAYLEYLRSGL